MAGPTDPERLHLLRQEAHRLRLVSLLLGDRWPMNEIEVLARDLDALADRLECEARRQRSFCQLKDQGTLR
jgi:hypothetical protein